MRLTFLGVRGSTPATGAAHARYGGNTSCIAVSTGEARPSLLVDAGTGIAAATGLLDGHPFRGTILLSHLHWDHTHGLPFFSGADRDDAETRLLLPAQGDPVEVIRRVMSPPHFPIGPEELRGRWTFEGLEAGSHEIEGLSVLALEIPHPGGRTFGFRITDATGSVAYLSDHGPVALGPGDDGFGPYHEAALELAAGVDVLVHDSQHTATEFATRAHFGHSTIDYAVGLAAAAQARRLVLFHHDPFRSDDGIDAVLDQARTLSRLPVEAAAEGLVIELAAAVAPGDGRSTATTSNRPEAVRAHRAALSTARNPGGPPDANPTP